MIETNRSDMDLEERKEVRVKIPLGYHLKLHSMKVLTGKQISDTVTEALETYFEELQGEEERSSMLAEELE